MTTTTRRRLPRLERARLAAQVAQEHGGVAHRRELRAVGVSRADVRTEVGAGRWIAIGRHTVVIGNREPVGSARLWHVLWETGAGAALDGASALVASGLAGFEPAVVDVSVPERNRRHRVAGVRRHRRRTMPAVCASGIPRVEVAAAAINAAAWATSHRQAVLLLALVLQQRLTTPDRLLAAWHGSATRVPAARRALLNHALVDLCDGAQSLGELDFAKLCRQHGLPPPGRQAVRSLANGRIYLDVAWAELGLVVEIDGGHHALALGSVDDALRQNEVVLREDHVLRIPVLGLRLMPDRFMAQVVQAHHRWSRRAA